MNATAKDADGAIATTSVSTMYTKAPPTTNNITVYFENTGGWLQPKVYCWAAVPSTYTCLIWPGTNMTKVASCGNWWSYTFIGVSSTNLIFNNGSNIQTADLNRTAVGTYNYSWLNKVWVNGMPTCTAIAKTNLTDKSFKNEDEFLTSKIKATIIPNPIVNNSFLLKISSPISGKGIVRITDAAGMSVKEINNLNILAGNNFIPVTTSFRSAGFYIAILQLADTKVPIKLTVIK